MYLCNSIEPTESAYTIIYNIDIMHADRGGVVKKYSIKIIPFDNNTNTRGRGERDGRPL